MPKKLLLVDCPNQAFRAYHGIQTDMRAPDGFPTRALFGFTRILKALIRDVKPEYVACVFDRGADARIALWPEYKGTRPDMPDDLRQQWPEFEPLCEASGYKVMSIQGVEADDIIGTLAVQFASDDVHVAIVSGDKDFCQLVNDQIHVLDVMKGIEVGPKEVVERWGVPADKIIDLLSLMGDTSDNVPGVPGVGPKKAVRFILQFGSLDGVLDNATKIGGKTGEAVYANADLARLARQLVTIDTKMELGVTLEDFRVREPDAEELRKRLTRYNFKTLWNELALGERAEVKPIANFDGSSLTTVWGPGPIAALGATMRAVGRVTVHADAPDGQLRRLFFSWAGGRAIVPVDDAALRHLKPILQDKTIKKTGFEMKLLNKQLGARGVGLAGVVGDIALADYLLVAEQKRTLDHLTQRYLEEPVATDVADQVAQVQRLDAIFEEKLGLDKVYREIEIPLLPILAEMERAGILVEVDRLATFSTELGARIATMQQEIYALAGEEFNINSTLQLATILYDKRGLEAGKKTKTGRSTDADTLEKLNDPLATAVLAFRELYKLKNTYVDALPKTVASDGRIHTTYGQAVAATGRLSSNDPNLQNIPVRTEDGRRIRQSFVAREGCVLLSADYSQIELRVLAHYCKEGPLVESFLNGEDIHRRTASEIFGVSPLLVTGEMRRAAKAINFGIVYGMGAFRLANELRISRSQAAAYIEGYFARYPQVRGTMDAAAARARELGYAETLYGRKRPVAGLDAGNPNDRAAAERIAINTPIQGTAADLIKLAMIRVDAALRGMETRMLLQVHDELVFEAPIAEVADVTERIRDAMENVATLRVPLKVDVGSARTWAEAH